MKRAAAVLAVLVGVVTTLVTLVPETPALAAERPIVLAQNQGFFQRLFGGGSRRRMAPPPSQQQLFPGFERIIPRQQAPRRERRARAPAQTAPREIAAVKKADDAKRVMVIGDFMAGALAKGLADAYSENPNVLVIDASNGSSGLVRDDYYDWPAKLPGLVTDQKPDAILVMIGGNDRQTIKSDSGSEAPGTDGWRAAYAARVATFADALKATTKPVLWSGLVPVEASSMSRDYSSFNGIVREQLEAKGLRFIDIWNGFADDEGKYVAIGPDIRGQSVQLRASDGLNFTRAGQRKLAYFLEQELNDILGGQAPLLASADAAAAAVPAGPEAPKIGPMVPLEALSLAGGSELSAAPAAARGTAAAAIAARLSDDDAELPPEARVDSFVWPPRRAAATPAANASDGEANAAAASTPPANAAPAGSAAPAAPSP
jgi:hypothetical protein